jgi:predicted PurR-regulated permease PerM
VLVFIIGASVTGAYALRGPAARAANRLPEVSERLRTELQLLRSYADGQRGTLGAIEQAADDLDAAASEVAGATVDDAPRTFDIGFRQWIVIGSMSAVGWTGQVLLLLFLVYFLLVSSDLFKRKLVRLAGPSLASRRVTVSAIDDVHAGLERFIAITVGLNVALGVATAAAFHLYGLPSAAVWGLMGGLLNFVPFIGSAAAAVLFFVVAFMQFDSMTDAAAVAAIWIGLSSLEGSLIKPCLIGHTARINNVAVFTCLIFWGWVWGAWGLLLAFPILMAVKLTADRVEALHPLSELLST